MYELIIVINFGLIMSRKTT